MPVPKQRVAIIGGSISGCAAAQALLRAGWEVEVFERSATGLRERGSGIGIPVPLRETLMAEGYLPQNYPNIPMQERWWQYPDGSDMGRTLWVQPTPAAANNWGILWSALRANVPDACYHNGKALTDYSEDADGVTAVFEDGSRARFDLMIAADGYRSICRARMHAQSEAEFSGYVLWRGNYPEAELADTGVFEAADRTHAWITVPFEGGHGVLYMIPDREVGKRRVNWAIYAGVPEGLEVDGVSSIPPGAVSEAVHGVLLDLLERDFPPAVAALVAHSRREDVSIQPIFDSIVSHYHSGRVVLVGDAGSMTRPHTASGATKALEDVLALERLLETQEDLPALLAAYDAERCGAAQELCEIGRNIGQAQVVETPDWAAMGAAEFTAWIADTMAGRKLYLYGDR